MYSHLVHMMVQSQDIQKYPTCCSLRALFGLTLGTYNDTELGSLGGSTEEITEGNYEDLFLGD